MLDWYLKLGEWRRCRAYPSFKAKLSNAEDHSEFVAWVDGPWTEEFVRHIPLKDLREGPPMNGNDPKSRSIIDAEIERRFQSTAPVVANVLALLAFAVSVAALIKSW